MSILDLVGETGILSRNSMTEMANCIETYERMCLGSVWDHSNRTIASMECIIFILTGYAPRMSISPPAAISEPRYTSAATRAPHS